MNAISRNSTCPKEIFAIYCLIQNLNQNYIYKNHQLCFFNDYAVNVLKKHFTSSQLAMVFEMNAKIVRRSLENDPQDPKPPGRHDKIEDEKEEIIINEILRLEDECHPMREKEILKFIKSKFVSDLTQGWFNCFFVRHIKRLKKCHSIPQQDTRLSVPREFLFQHLINMREIVENRIAELVLNLDEVGVSELEDKKPFKVIVSRRNPNKTFEHAVSRNNTHVTLVACIAASGASLAPLLICKNKVPNSF